MKATRGIVWIGVGALLQGVSVLAGTPLVIRGTKIPWGIVVMGVGLLLIAWDTWRARRRGDR